ncbi:MAG: hypothetical protein QXT19_04220 [Candidatus Woesearchaeota archaeon]
MNKLFLALVALSVVFVIGCQPSAPAPAAPAAPAPAAPEAAPAAPSEPAMPEETPAEEYREIDIEKACYELLSAADFVSICGYGGNIVLTPKVSASSCWINIADQRNNKLTAGFTVVDWKKAKEANKEFDRGVKARVKQGAVEGDAVGERSYEYDEIARHNVVWVRGKYLTRLGAMNALCPADKLVEVARKIDAGLH